MSGGLDRIAAEKALRAPILELSALHDRLQEEGHWDLAQDCDDALADGNDGARLKAYIVQARIALGLEPAPEHVPTVMMSDELAEMRALVSRSPRVVPEPRTVKPPRTFTCTACEAEVEWSKLRCPGCGAKVLADPAVRSLVLAARAAALGHTAGLVAAIWAVEGRTIETKEEERE